jgi:hypothetical protein
MSLDPNAPVSPSGDSIIGSLIKGERDPTAIPKGQPPSGGVGGGLQQHDMDCASDSLLGFITEPLCVAGKSITKGSNVLGGPCVPNIPIIKDIPCWLVIVGLVIGIVIMVTAWKR